MGMKTTATAGGDFELPSEDNHRAAVVAYVDLGTQSESYQGGPPEDKRQVFVVWELLEERTSSGAPHLIGRKYTFSLNEKAGLRKVYEACAGTVPDGREVDLDDILGKPCMLDVRLEDGKEGRKYVKVAAVTPAAKGERGKKAKTTHEPFCWYFDSGAACNLPDWLPYCFGRKVADVIAGSKERKRMGQPVGAAAEADDDRF